MKILVYHTGNLTDVLLATPLIRCLRHRYRSAEIHAVTSDVGLQVLKENLSIDRLHEWRRDDALLTVLAAETFNCFIDLQNDKHSRQLAKNLRLPAMAVPEQKFEPVAFFRILKKGFAKTHTVDRYFEAVEPLGVVNDGGGMDFPLSEEERVAATDIPHSHHAGFLCLGLAAEGTAKLPAEAIRLFCQRIDHPVVLIGGKTEAAFGENFAAIDPVKLYNACGKFSLHEMADLVQHAKLVVALQDTSLVQVTAALKRPLVLLGGKDGSPAKKPYYGAGFLKGNPRPFDVVPTKGRLSGLRKAEPLTGDILESVQRRLRSR